MPSFANSGEAIRGTNKALCRTNQVINIPWFTRAAENVLDICELVHRLSFHSTDRRDDSLQALGLVSECSHIKDKYPDCAGAQQPKGIVRPYQIDATQHTLEQQIQKAPVPQLCQKHCQKIDLP